MFPRAMAARRPTATGAVTASRGIPRRAVGLEAGSPRPAALLSLPTIVVDVAASPAAAGARSSHGPHGNSMPPRWPALPPALLSPTVPPQWVCAGARRQLLDVFSSTAAAGRAIVNLWRK
mgnify:CR=1 FL=1